MNSFLSYVFRPCNHVPFLPPGTGLLRARRAPWKRGSPLAALCSQPARPPVSCARGKAPTHRVRCCLSAVCERPRSLRLRIEGALRTQLCIFCFLLVSASFRAWTRPRLRCRACFPRAPRSRRRRWAARRRWSVSSRTLRPRTSASRKTPRPSRASASLDR